MTTSSPISSFKAFEDERYDYIFKLVVVGDSGVGKSSLVNQFCHESFTFDLKSTIGVEFNVKTVEVNGKIIKSQLWDTAGQERYRSVAASYYRGALGAVLVFDVTYTKSFLNLPFWIDEVKRYCADAKILLVGNKTDLKDLRGVTHADAFEFAAANNLMYVESSAKDNGSVGYAFKKLLGEVQSDRELAMKAQQTFSNVRTRNPEEKKPSVGETIKLEMKRKEERRTLGKLDKFGIRRDLGKEGRRDCC
ncbi:hypothetical protein TrRE_jg3910 [Triparma retinervis]|uniref:Uncharacterized protein n=1 Tax=Triparma retinervis TaxID=2557542 RepID=A0A9W7E3G5_9STRA|nr:hypothetical protein TrRE_jg3910 [Triparma retinervis]